MFYFSTMESQESSQSLSEVSSQGSYVGKVEDLGHKNLVTQLNSLLSSSLEPVDFQVVECPSRHLATKKIYFSLKSVSLQSPPVTAGRNVACFFDALGPKLFSMATCDQMVMKYILQLFCNAFIIFPMSQIAAGDSICEKERNLKSGQVTMTEL